MPVSKNRRKNGKKKKYNAQKTHTKMYESAVTQALREAEQSPSVIQDAGSVTIIPPSVGCGAGVQNENP